MAPEDLSIDINGVFRHEGVEITHPGTVELFFKNLEPDGRGGYIVRVGREWSPVYVEDAPFVVRSVRENEDFLKLILNDGTSERLDPRTLEVGGNNVLYCRVKDGRFPARFARPAYYQIARHIEALDGNTDFVLAIPSGRFPISTRGL